MRYGVTPARRSRVQGSGFKSSDLEIALTRFRAIFGKLKTSRVYGKLVVNSEP